ncbi:MAG: acyl-CoA thioesterase [Candidatus Geothermarchaeales archaeon]
MTIPAFKASYPIRFRDLDVLGHVNNAVYFTYMEMARVEYYQHLTDKKNLEGFDLILAHISCDFLKPLTLGDTVEISLWPTEIGNTSFTLEYEIRKKNSREPAARGRSVMVTYDYQSNMKKPIPDDLRRQLEEEAEAARQGKTT